MKPDKGETLYLYISASQLAISTVLVKEKDQAQHPIYFVSRALQGPETRYTPLERLILALVHAARRLRPHFQEHTIVLLTNYPIRQILLKPEASGRMMKWAIELGEHDIQFRPRTAIKGQVLADFILESTEPVNPDVEQPSLSEGAWQLYVDGSSHSGGEWSWSLTH